MLLCIYMYSICFCALCIHIRFYSPYQDAIVWYMYSDPYYSRLQDIHVPCCPFTRPKSSYISRHPFLRLHCFFLRKARLTILILKIMHCLLRDHHTEIFLIATHNYKVSVHLPASVVDLQICLEEHNVGIETFVS